MTEQDDLNVPVIACVGVVSVVLTVACVLAVQALYNQYAGYEQSVKVIQAPTPDSDSKLAEQEAKLARYGWVNQKEGRVAIPVERAMERLVEEASEMKRETAVSSETEGRDSRTRK